MIKNLYKIGNAVDDIYTKIAGVPYPVSAAVGKKPIPEPVEVTSTVTYTETEATVWKMEMSIEWPEGMSFEALTTQYPDWTGSVTSGEKVVTFTADDITVDYITVTDLTIDSVPSDGDECTVAIMNGDVELYNSTTAAHVVEVPVPAEPTVSIENVVLTVNLEDYNLTADLQVEDAPEGWLGWFSIDSNDTIEFTANDITNGRLYVEVTGNLQAMPTTNIAHGAIFNGEPSIENVIWEDESIEYSLIDNTQTEPAEPEEPELT